MKVLATGNLANYVDFGNFLAVQGIEFALSTYDNFLSMLKFVNPDVVIIDENGISYAPETIAMWLKMLKYEKTVNVVLYLPIDFPERAFQIIAERVCKSYPDLLVSEKVEVVRRVVGVSNVKQMLEVCRTISGSRTSFLTKLKKSEEVAVAHFED
ncbi:MAG: hypothetical protein WC663_04060 [Patescibacteria group bacterium]|jgi:hypothetical protein